GLFHVVPRGETTWHDFAQAIFQHARACDVALAVQPEKVVGIETQHYPTPAKRPLNSRLSVGKLEDALGVTLPSWQQQLALTLDEALMNAH
ncbi:MAG: sugar nucleotide-binding protein, partial [Pseudomonadota bacterium]|nr:sugar nucleotide-binding protein [Pseudomonadota bacterium]